MLMGLDGAATRGAFHDPGSAHPPSNPISALLSALLNPASAQHGDAVYTQEALDRVISQLMEQNATGNAPGPASAEAMANLPKINVTKEMLGDNGKAECSICMDEVHLGDEVTQLYCKHWFHEQCVKAWLGEHDTCPHCRKGISDISEQQQQGPSTPSGQRRSSASASRNTPGTFSDNTDHWRRSNSSGMRRASDHRSGRRASDTAGGGGGGGGGGSGGGGGGSSGSLLDRARRSFFGGRS
jgi:E3 ubiquitin-protein ligase RNF115/126